MVVGAVKAALRDLSKGRQCHLTCISKASCWLLWGCLWVACGKKGMEELKMIPVLVYVSTTRLLKQEGLWVAGSRREGAGLLLILVFGAH